MTNAICRLVYSCPSYLHTHKFTLTKAAESTIPQSNSMLSALLMSRQKHKLNARIQRPCNKTKTGGQEFCCKKL